MSTIRETTPDDFAALYGVPLVSQVLEIDGAVAAVGCLMRRPDGRVFANLDVVRPALLWADGMRAVLAMRRVLAEAPRPVFAGCWQARYPKAPRLFRLLGFRPTDEMLENGNLVWVLE
jgi:hypothetical protein